MVNEQVNITHGVVTMGKLKIFFGQEKIDDRPTWNILLAAAKG